MSDENQQAEPEGGGALSSIGAALIATGAAVKVGSIAVDDASTVDPEPVTETAIDIVDGAVYAAAGAVQAAGYALQGEFADAGGALAGGVAGGVTTAIPYLQAGDALTLPTTGQSVTGHVDDFVAEHVSGMLSGVSGDGADISAADSGGFPPPTSPGSAKSASQEIG